MHQFEIAATRAGNRRCIAQFDRGHQVDSRRTDHAGAFLDLVIEDVDALLVGRADADSGTDHIGAGRGSLADRHIDPNLSSNRTAGNRTDRPDSCLRIIRAVDRHHAVQLHTGWQLQIQRHRYTPGIRRPIVAHTEQVGIRDITIGHVDQLSAFRIDQGSRDQIDPPLYIDAGRSINRRRVQRIAIDRIQADRTAVLDPVWCRSRGVEGKIQACAGPGLKQAEVPQSGIGIEAALAG